MIIKYMGTTIGTRDKDDVTYWFSVQLQGYECTSVDVGFSAEGKLISASKTFFELEESQKALIEAQTAPMVEKVV